MEAKAKVFECDKCGAAFKRAGHLTQHKNRKTPCKIDVNVIAENDIHCIYCNRKYSAKFNLTKHQKTCKMKNGGIEKIPDANERIAEQLRILNEEQKRKDEERDRKEEELRLQNERMERELAEIKELMKSMSERPVVVNNGTINNNSNNTTNINLNVYNQPNIDFLLQAPDIVRRIISECGVTMPIRLITPIWYSDKRPENHSVIVDPKKPSQCKVHGEFGWETRDTDETANEIRRSACDVAKMLLREIAPEVRGIAGPIEDSKWAQDHRTAEENAEVKKKMIYGSQNIVAGGVK